MALVISRKRVRFKRWVKTVCCLRRRRTVGTRTSYEYNHFHEAGTETLSWRQYRQRNRKKNRSTNSVELQAFTEPERRPLTHRRVAYTGKARVTEDDTSSQESFESQSFPERLSTLFRGLSNKFKPVEGWDSHWDTPIGLRAGPNKGIFKTASNRLLLRNNDSIRMLKANLKRSMSRGRNGGDVLDEEGSGLRRPPNGMIQRYRPLISFAANNRHSDEFDPFI